MRLTGAASAPLVVSPEPFAASARPMAAGGVSNNISAVLGVFVGRGRARGTSGVVRLTLSGARGRAPALISGASSPNSGRSSDCGGSGAPMMRSRSNGGRDSSGPRPPC